MTSETGQCFTQYSWAVSRYELHPFLWYHSNRVCAILLLPRHQFYHVNKFAVLIWNCILSNTGLSHPQLSASISASVHLSSYLYWVRLFYISDSLFQPSSFFFISPHQISTVITGVYCMYSGHQLSIVLNAKWILIKPQRETRGDKGKQRGKVERTN